MYKVLIADDEFWVAALIRNSIDWDTMGLELIGEASDGEEACEKILSLHPDIVITDIRMPGLNGIELMEKIRLMRLKVEFIILSGFDSFAYAQAAVKYNAVSFVLKPLDEEELRQALLTAVERLHSIHVFQETTAQAQSQLEELRNAFFFRTIKAESEDSFSASLETINQKYSCHFQEGHFFVITAQLERIPDPALCRKAAERSLALLRASALDAYFLSEERRFICIVNASFSPLEDYRKLAALLFQCQESLCRQADIPVSAALGTIETGWPRLYRSYAVSCRLLRSRVTDGFGRLYLWDSQRNASDNPHVHLPISWELHLSTLIETFETEELEGSLKNILDQVIQVSPGSDLLFLVLEELIKIYRQTVNQMHIGDLTGLMTQQQYLACLEQCDSLPQLKQLLCRLFVHPLERYRQEQSCSETNISSQIKLYISKHYQENIRLIDIADHLYRNPSYIGYIFKRDMGISFSEYLAAYRINIAKAYLLDTRLTISNVAEAVGFGDTHHFSKTFKKLVGMTPAAYRKKSVR